MGNYNVKYEVIDRDNPKKKILINEESKNIYIK